MEAKSLVDSNKSPWMASYLEFTSVMCCKAKTQTITNLIVGLPLTVFMIFYIIAIWGFASHSHIDYTDWEKIGLTAGSVIVLTMGLSFLASCSALRKCDYLFMKNKNSRKYIVMKDGKFGLMGKYVLTDVLQINPVFDDIKWDDAAQTTLTAVKEGKTYHFSSKGEILQG